MKAANAHYSDDLLSSLLNEPIPGHGVFWSSVSGRPFPISFRAMLFEKQYRTLDPKYDADAVETYASQLRQRLRGDVQQVLHAASTIEEKGEGDIEEDDSHSEPVDFRKLARQQAIEALRKDTQFHESLDRNGIPWGIVIQKLKDFMPETIQDRDDFAHSIVAEALETIVGTKDAAWHTTRRAARSSGREMTWIVKGPNP